MEWFRHRLRPSALRLVVACALALLWAQFAGIHVHGETEGAGAHVHVAQAAHHAHHAHHDLAGEVDISPLALAKLLPSVDLPLALVTGLLLLLLTPVLRRAASPARSRWGLPAPPSHLAPPLRAPPA
ncbi:hypothetical protein HUS23_10150 [Ectothiorhodospiraceae bacterium 2226]|nr:hypothetical protein HUS23_10150 [Ectothiorhodospiraceae bacterium 2226]